MHLANWDRWHSLKRSNQTFLLYLEWPFPRHFPDTVTAYQFLIDLCDPYLDFTV